MNIFFYTAQKFVGIIGCDLQKWWPISVTAPFAKRAIFLIYLCHFLNDKQMYG
jgi:hypothetical protein